MEHIKETQIFIMVILQALYYISGIGILIVAIIGLKQLKIAKQNLIIRSRREANTI
jgi:Trk-type K+ transport system membrane component